MAATCVTPWTRAPVNTSNGVACSSGAMPSSSGRGSCGLTWLRNTQRRCARVGAAGGQGKPKRRKSKRKTPGDAELQPLKTSFPTSLDWPEFSYDRFHLGEIVGQGSYGDVFEGFDSQEEREVAVKRMTKFRDSNSVEKTLFKLAREVCRAIHSSCQGLQLLSGPKCSPQHLTNLPKATCYT